MAVFVGSPQEHLDFQHEFHVQIDYLPTSNLLELAQIIQGAEMIFANQSCALAIAIAMGKSYWCEPGSGTLHRTPHGGFGDCWFPRPNAIYG